MITRDVEITCPGGIHALVAQKLAIVANGYGSSMFLRHEGRTASAGHPVSVLALGLRTGVRVTVLADGLDEAAALEAVSEVLAPRPPSHPSTPDNAKRTLS